MASGNSGADDSSRQGPQPSSTETWDRMGRPISRPAAPDTARGAPCHRLRAPELAEAPPSCRRARSALLGRVVYRLAHLAGTQQTPVSSGSTGPDLARANRLAAARTHRPGRGSTRERGPRMSARARRRRDIAASTIPRGRPAGRPASAREDAGRDAPFPRSNVLLLHLHVARRCVAGSARHPRTTIIEQRCRSLRDEAARHTYRPVTTILD